MEGGSDKKPGNWYLTADNYPTRTRTAYQADTARVKVSTLPAVELTVSPLVMCGSVENFALFRFWIT